jgi:hypothetical protein
MLRIYKNCMPHILIWSYNFKSQMSIDHHYKFYLIRHANLHHVGHFKHYILYMKSVFNSLPQPTLLRIYKDCYAKWTFAFWKWSCKNNGKTDFYLSIHYMFVLITCIRNAFVEGLIRTWHSFFPASFVFSRNMWKYF